ncbi:ABC transporter ATP-binding protein [Methylocystis parvus]|uniref:ABC transporter ATP-binding protein n=1 Tax=Methylocystis parvus TaxID=134 RepID=A0A6B8M4U4_9HYPH|nr:ABC transporter ATP-binding protein [Methylocystis parvus]QGM97396.1 ABC transporter ATP-binding protein [Methylocystis parvus]WBJ98691.1 ABC transporter ATP-binding protein [Methylocystis parvus OBBP]
MIELEDVYKYYKSNGHRKVVLNHISLEFQAGRSYGILGVNGAGKSTLVRILAGTELPNGGRVRRKVRVSWPLGFSGGLHPKLTGRENVKFISRIYGQDPRKIITFVEDFAEVGAYMDVPIMTYSSGMIARLAFGLSMSIDFDCYLIDEVTAVGDARFAARCKEEFDRRRKKADIVMVSHAMSTIKDYCDRGIVLAGGQMHVFRDVDDAIELYKKLNA